MKDDIQAIGLLAALVGAAIFITLVFVGLSQWLAGVAWRIGLTSGPAQFTIYAMGLLLCIGVSLSILGRLIEGKWWFKS